MKTFLPIALALVGCGAANGAQAPPPGPVCLTSARVLVDESLVDYGTTYEPGLNGPAPSLPISPSPGHMTDAGCEDSRGPGS
jgi:hypothetical protein